MHTAILRQSGGKRQTRVAGAASEKAQRALSGALWQSTA